MANVNNLKYLIVIHIITIAINLKMDFHYIIS